MKKLCLIALCAIFALSMTACSSKSSGDWDWKSEKKAESTGVTLNVYNWGEYIDDEVLNVNKAFEHITGNKVNYKTFTDNESMYAMISSGAVSYDVICPSDYMIGKMINENLLQKLDFNNIPNYKYIDETLKNPVYDPKNEYSVPYTWGTVGIFYNTKYVDEADLKDGWDLLWNEKYKGKIIMFDNPRDAFGVALKKLGYSMNTTKEAEWNAAYQELAKQKPLLYGYAMDGIYQKMINAEAYIAPYYAGDGRIMMDENDGNPDIDFFVPEVGTNRFIDAWCIPKGAVNKKAAEEYINFLCRTEVAKANAEYICYSTPHTEAKEQLEDDVKNNPDFYPPQELLDKCEIFNVLPDSTNQLQSDLWDKLKK